MEKESLETSASFGQTISYDGGEVSLSEVISALTFALDMTDGAVPGHSLRSCLVGMRLAKAIGVPQADLSDLYYALLLKDIGCSDNLARFSQIMGDDGRAPWAASAWGGDVSPDPAFLERAWREVLPDIPLPGQIGRLLGSAIAAGSCRDTWETRGLRVTEVVKNLGMSSTTIQAICHTDERWDGSGSPAGLRGNSIPMLARICSVAQTLDAYATEHGPETALRLVRSRRGTWFDPEIVRIAQQLHSSGKLWQGCQVSDVEATRAEVLRGDPGVSTALTPERVDRICEAFGNVVDGKSPFTYHHSIGVTDVAVSLAETLELAPERVSLVRRAAFLHDIGKLAVPNGILDKRGRLTPAEWTHITRHPSLSGCILRRVGAFRELAALAAEHHERLDGSGYPFGLRGDQISLESRVIAIADCYAAMAEDRPYRLGLSTAQILSNLAEDVPGKLDATCFEALCAATLTWGSNMPNTLAAPAPARSLSPHVTATHGDVHLRAC